MSAENADYRVFPNGTAYLAAVQIEDVSRYEFADTGVIGEQIPFDAGNVHLDGRACSNCSFTWSGSSTILFDRGNYTISYVGPVHENHVQAFYDSPYNVTVVLPQEFDVRNPLLAGISPGANVTRYPDNTTSVRWEGVTSIDLRFYDQAHEQLLYLFGNVWIFLAILVIVSYLISERNKE